jgi:hypothetical protein
MFKKILLVCGIFAFAFAILSVSILESSSVSYKFTSQVPGSSVLEKDVQEIDYQFPNPGEILPDNPLWVLKAARDRIWYIITPSPLKKAELALLFSDKRLVASQILFENKKPNIAISTLTKGEKYLQLAVTEEVLARSEGYDTSAFLNKLALASLKHGEVIENLLPLVPEDGKPLVIETENYSRDSYKVARGGLYSKGLPAPIDPFGGD